MNRIPRHAGAVLSALALAVALLPGPATAEQEPLNPSLVPKFVEPLTQPAILNGMATSAATPLVITASEFQQKVLPASFYAGLPAPYQNGTYVWGYNGTWPGPTIAARRGVPTHVKYVNALENGGEPLFLQQTLKVDQTIHWADPLGQHPQTSPYLGPVPAVAHLHGGEVPSAYDGGPDAWWTPTGIRGPGYVTDQYAYPNGQEATALFYHDHALGMTRINVYAGLAAFYLLLDPDHEPADLPGGSLDTPADMYGNPFMVGMAIQDRMFDTNGQLYFPDEGINPEHPHWIPEFFGDVMTVNGHSWPYMNVEPRRYRFRIVNGSNARFYEMRLTDRQNRAAGPAFWQIGSDGGLLDSPVMLNDPLNKKAPRLVMAPGERADIVIDFARYHGKTLYLVNSAKAPFPKGTAPDPNGNGMIMQFRVGQTVSAGSDPSLDPAITMDIRPHAIERLTVGPVRRALTLNEAMGEGGPLEVLVNNTMWGMMPSENVQVGDTEVWEIVNLTADTHPIHLHLFQFQLVNRQAFNVHGYARAYGMPMEGMGPPLPYDQVDAATGFKLGGNPDVTPFLQGLPMPPDPNETGWKDTFRMNPGEVTRIVVRAAPQDANQIAADRGVTPGPGVNLYPFEPWVAMGGTDAFGYPGGPGYVWHCHIIDHEDNEMMRPLMLLGPDAPMARTVPAPAALPPVLPASVELAASRPNPAVHAASLVFRLPAPARVELAIYDLTGRQVRSLADGTFAAGEHAVRWDGRDDAGQQVATGAYFYRLRSGTTTQVRKLAFLR